MLPGLIVHKALEKGKCPQTPSVVASQCSKIQALMKAMKITILDREVYQQYPMGRGIRFTRVLDVIGKLNNEKVIVDYKTCRYPWWEEAYPVVPMSATIQAASYLLNFGKSAWPTSMFFLVASEMGGTKYYEYRRNIQDEKNLYAAIQLVQLAVKAKLYPRNPGKMCQYCDYFNLCWKIDGYKKLYVERTRNENHSKSRRKD